jgi:hypothetical protein
MPASATTLVQPCFNGLDGIACTSRGLLLNAQEGFASVVDCTQAKEFAFAHWLVGGADGGWLFARCYDAAMNVRENFAGDVLTSLTTMVWNAPSKSWTGGATMSDASLNRRDDGAPRRRRRLRADRYRRLGRADRAGGAPLYGLPEAVPALLCGTPTLPVGRREFAVAGNEASMLRESPPWRRGRD